MTNKQASKDSWRTRGYLTQEGVDLPPGEILNKGPVAIIECPQRIPCDPCSRHCPVEAIEMEDINSLPEVDYEKCTGCGICVEHCPGLAIFTVDCSGSGGCQVTIPYEFPLPEVGEEVDGLNRKGEAITRVTVSKVKPRSKSVGDTSTVTVTVPRAYVNQVRNIRRKKS